MVSRTGIDENTSKEHEQNALPDILMTMSQIPDVNRELADVGAVGEGSELDLLKSAAAAADLEAQGLISFHRILQR